MLCLSCKRPMIVVEYQSIELDYCTNCGGVWFDSSELELFLRSAKLENSELSLNVLQNYPSTSPTHGGRKCPICRRGLKEVAVGEPAISLDICARGDGYWFDGGEVQELLTQLAQKATSKEGKPRQVFTFIGEVFQARKESK
jgi:Zn-finger nucleic acid-binding protein